MKVAIHLSAEEEAKALSVLLRHSPGMALANRTCVVDAEAVRSLRDARVTFTDVVPTADGFRTK